MKNLFLLLALCAAVASCQKDEATCTKGTFEFYNPSQHHSITVFAEDMKNDETEFIQIQPKTSVLFETEIVFFDENNGQDVNLDGGTLNVTFENDETNERRSVAFIPRACQTVRVVLQ